MKQDDGDHRDRPQPLDIGPKLLLRQAWPPARGFAASG